MRWIAILALCACRSKSREAATPEQRAEIQRLLDQRVVAVEREDAERHAKLFAASQKPIDPNAPQCPERLSASEQYYAADRVDGIFETASPGARVRQIRQERDRVISLSNMKPQSDDQSPERLLSYAPTLGTFWNTELTIVVDNKRDVGTPKLDNDRPLGQLGSFTAGATHGRAFLYDYQKRAIVCAGTFAAASSGDVEVDTSNVMGGRADQREISKRAEHRAQYDLDTQTVAAAIQSLRVVTP